MEINKKQIIDIIIATSIISTTLFSAIAIIAESNTQHMNKISFLRSEKESWTVIVYLDGDNSLCKYAQQELDEIKEVQLKDNITIVVLFDERGEDNTHCYLFGEETEEIPLSKLCTSWKYEINMGDQFTLENFVMYAMGNYPAHHYLVELWGHGYGQEGMCSDETSCDRLSMQEMVSALTKASEENDDIIDILVLTSCYMGEIECIQKLKGTANHIIASDEEVPASGLPHTKIFNSLIENPQSLPEEVNDNIIETYHKHYDFTSESLTLF
jgi:hypothetical protein